MKKLTFIVLTLLLLSSCEAFFSQLTPLEPIEQSNNTQEIPKGWKIDTDSDYSKLNWNASFEISEDGNEISFIDSKGIPVTIVKDETSLTFSEDKPKAIFKENEIELKIKDLSLVFQKQMKEQIT